MQIEVIIGVSFFSGAPCVGVALVGEADGINLCKAAEAAACGNRPATIQTLNGRTAADQISYLVGKWESWAEAYGIPLSINTRPRKVGRF